MKNMRIFFDTNILLDFLLGRKPFCDSAQTLFELCKNKQIEGFVAAHSLSNMFYILRKDLSNEERREFLLDICSIFSICGIDKQKIVSALKNNSFDDFEDGLQHECAVSEYLEAIITRNKDDFASSLIPVYTADEFIRAFL